MLLSYEVVLVAVDAEGRFREPYASLEAGLAGGLLMELALSGCISETGGLIAVRRGSFADPLLEQTARRLADGSVSVPARLVADVEGRDGEIRGQVLRRMEQMGLGRRCRGGVREAVQESVEAGEVVRPDGDDVRFIPSAPDVGVALVDGLARAVQTLEMPGDVAPLTALAMASGVWRPPRQTSPMRFEDSLMRQTLDRIPRSVRSSAEAVIQGVVARTLASRVARYTGRALRRSLE